MAGAQKGWKPRGDWEESRKGRGRCSVNAWSVQGFAVQNEQGGSAGRFGFCKDHQVKEGRAPGVCPTPFPFLRSPAPLWASLALGQ
jgi:hypothetical protein